MSVGAEKGHIRNFFDSIVNFVKSRANRVCTSTCDGLILRMHYRWTYFILIGTVIAIWYSWYHEPVISCSSHFNADIQIRLDYLNVCLSYPYVDDGNGSKRYLLFYRWIPFALLLLTSFYYIPRKVSKIWDNVRSKQLLEDLAVRAPKYDHSERNSVAVATNYIIFNIKTHNGLYWKYLGVNIIALLIDIFAMNFLDYILHGRFIQYGFKSFPFQRDPEKFTDYMSQTFPQFVLCELSQENQIVSKRIEKFGCHLTLMELYDKLFLVLWVWLIILTFLTCCYIVFLLLMWLPCVRLCLLRVSKPAHAHGKVRNVTHSALQHCKIGDVYLLYRLKQHLSHVMFYELMSRLADPYLLTKQLPPPISFEQVEQRMPNNGAPTHMNQHPQNPQTHPESFQPPMMAKNPWYPDLYPDLRVSMMKN